MSEPQLEFRPAAPLLPVLRTRESAYAYECRACGRCCHDKLIPVNPYEVARLAANRGLSTTEVIARYTDGGVALAAAPDGACVFLGEGGCAVHEDRPLVCRLYPLGVVTDVEGGEGFVELAPHPGSEGRSGVGGTVESYLVAQGVPPYLAAARRYRATLGRLVLKLAAEDGAASAAAALRVSDGVAAPEFLDVDLALARLARRGVTLPGDLEARVQLHVALLEGELGAG